MRPKSNKRSGNHNRAMIHNRAALADRIAAFEEFEDSILPALRKDMQSGISAEDIYKKYQALAAARGISIALGEADAGKALAACRDILDRTMGKAKESQVVEHKLAKLPEKELDAYLLTQMNEIDSSEPDDQ